MSSIYVLSVRGRRLILTPGTDSFVLALRNILGETREPVESAEPGGRVATECGVTVQITAGATLRIYVGLSPRILVINYCDRTLFSVMKTLLFFRCLLLSKFILYLNSSVSYQKVINCSIQYILFLLPPTHPTIERKEKEKERKIYMMIFIMLPSHPPFYFL